MRSEARLIEMRPIVRDQPAPQEIVGRARYQLDGHQLEVLLRTLDEASAYGRFGKSSARFASEGAWLYALTARRLLAEWAKRGCDDCGSTLTPYDEVDRCARCVDVRESGEPL
jgi:hypothetical protein